MPHPEEQIAQFLAAHPPEIQALAQQLRDYLKAETQPTMELVALSTNSVNIGYGFTRKAWDCFCAIIVYSKHVNISLPSGAGLDDPMGLLHGTGKRVRHLKLKTLADVQTAEVKAILGAARAAAVGGLDEEPPVGEVRIFVRTPK